MDEAQNEPVEHDLSRGQGPGVSILDDEHRLSHDIRLVSRAVKNRWPVTDDVKQETVQRLRGIVNKTEVSVMTKAGPAVLEGPADANAVAASRVLGMMEGQNQSDEQHAAGKLVRQEHTHKVILSPDERRRHIEAIMAEAGAVIDVPVGAVEAAGVAVGRGIAGPEPVGGSNLSP